MKKIAKMGIVFCEKHFFHQRPFPIVGSSQLARLSWSTWQTRMPLDEKPGHSHTSVCGPKTLELATIHHSFLSSFSAVSKRNFAIKYAFFQVFRDLQSPLSGEKKCKHFSSPVKKKIGGELRLRRHSRQRRASRAPLGLPTPDVRSTLGQPWVNLGSTFGQPSVSSPAISDRFSLILQVSSIETEDKRTCVCKMVDFPIRKRDFRVRGWSGAFW